MTGCRPSGSLERSVSQSPNPTVSSWRGYAVPNQPSSSRNRSAPRSAARSTCSARPAGSSRKPRASQVFATVARSRWPSRTTSARTKSCRARLVGPVPASDQVHSTWGDSKGSPGSSTRSAPRSWCPARIRTWPCRKTSASNRTSPPHTTVQAPTVPSSSAAGPSGANSTTGGRYSEDRTPPAEATVLVPEVRASVVSDHSPAHPPPQWVRWGPLPAKAGADASRRCTVTGPLARLVTSTHCSIRWCSGQARTTRSTSSGATRSTRRTRVIWRSTPDAGDGPLELVTSTTRSRVDTVPSAWVIRRAGSRSGSSPWVGYASG